MNRTQTNELNMFVSLQAVLTSHREVWEKLPAFVTGVEELDEIVIKIRGVTQTQTQTRRSGATQEKTEAFQALGDAAYEISAAVRAWVSVTAKPELAGRVRFTRWELVNGRDSAVVARCQDIHDLAVEHLKSLGDYGVTTAKLANLKKKIESYMANQAKPRQAVATASAATSQLKELFVQANGLLSNRLDGLLVQFQSSAPVFFSEYSTARVRLARGGARASRITEVAPESTSGESAGHGLPKAA
jgi:hypothetical protein